MPVRRSARLLVLDEAGRVLLFRYDDGRTPPFWGTPGGMLLPGESYEAAAARELAEETGFTAPIGPMVRERDAVFAAGDVPEARWLERYFVVRVAGATPAMTRWTAEERRTIREVGWFSAAEVRGLGDAVRPEWVAGELARLA